jgi:hypothetical protein
MAGASAADAVADKKKLAAEKKRLRRQKAKSEKKDLKESSIKAHEELHKAQGVENLQTLPKGKNSTSSGPVVKLQDGQGAVSIEYVPEPLEALEDLKAATELAAIAADPSSTIEGITVSGVEDKASALAELDRIAKHFVPRDDRADYSGADLAELAALGTDAVVTAGKDDPKEIEEEARRAAAGTHRKCNTCYTKKLQAHQMATANVKPSADLHAVSGPSLLVCRLLPKLAKNFTAYCLRRSAR